MDLYSIIELQLARYACAYYWYDKSVVADSEYDRIFQSLKQRAAENPDEFRASCLYTEFKDRVTTNMSSLFDYPFTRYDRMMAERAIRRQERMQ